MCVPLVLEAGQGRLPDENSGNSARGSLLLQRKSGKAESQDMLPGWWKLTLFAREGVATSLVLFARLFYLRGR